MIGEGKETNNIEKIFGIWVASKIKLDAIKEDELRLRKSICERILKGAAGYTIKSQLAVADAECHKPILIELSAKLDIKKSIDEDELKLIFGELTEEEKECVKYKPSLIAAKYKKANTKNLDRAVTSKPAGTPTLSWKAI